MKWTFNSKNQSRPHTQTIDFRGNQTPAQIAGTFLEYHLRSIRNQEEDDEVDLAGTMTCEDGTVIEITGKGEVSVDWTYDVHAVNCQIINPEILAGKHPDQMVIPGVEK